MGQLLSLPMVFVGLLLVLLAYRSSHHTSKLLVIKDILTNASIPKSLSKDY